MQQTLLYALTHSSLNILLYFILTFKNETKYFREKFVSSMNPFSYSPAWGNYYHEFVFTIPADGLYFAV